LIAGATDAKWFVNNNLVQDLKTSGFIKQLYKR